MWRKENESENHHRISKCEIILTKFYVMNSNRNMETMLSLCQYGGPTYKFVPTLYNGLVVKAS